MTEQAGSNDGSGLDLVRMGYAAGAAVVAISVTLNQTGIFGAQARQIEIQAQETQHEIEQVRLLANMNTRLGALEQKDLREDPFTGKQGNALHDEVDELEDAIVANTKAITALAETINGHEFRIQQMEKDNP